MMETKEKEKVNYFVKDKGHWKRFFKLLTGRHGMTWKWYIFAVVLVAAYCFLAIWGINVDLDATQYTAKMFSADADTGFEPGLIEKLILAIVGSFAIYQVRSVVKNIMTATITRNTRVSVWRKLIHVPVSFFDKNNERETVSRITSDCSSLASFFKSVFVPIVTDIYAGVKVFFTLQEYDVRLSVTIAAEIPLVIIASIIIGKMYYSISKDCTKMDSLLTKKMTELMKNIPVTKAFSQVDKEERRSHGLIDKVFHFNVRYNFLEQVYYLSFDLISLLQTALVLYSRMYCLILTMKFLW